MKRKIIRAIIIVILSLMILASFGFNLLILWKQREARIFNAGVNQALASIYQQGQEGSVQINGDKGVLILIKEQPQ